MRNDHPLVGLTLITILLLSSTHGLGLTSKVSLTHVDQNKPFPSPRKLIRPTPNSENNNNYRHKPLYSISLRKGGMISAPKPPEKATTPRHNRWSVYHQHENLPHYRHGRLPKLYSIGLSHELFNISYRYPCFITRVSFFAGKIN